MHLLVLHDLFIKLSRSSQRLFSSNLTTI